MEEDKTIVEKKEKGNSLSILEDQNIAKIFFDSGIFKEVKNMSQAMVKIIAGREQGLTPIESMNSVFIFNEQISYYTKVFTAKIKKSKDLDYKVKEATEEICTVEFYQSGKLLGTSSFSWKQAAKAGLVNKDSWKKYPQSMLYNRAVSNGIKMFMPQVLGGANIYEDIDDLSELKKGNAINVNMETGEVTPAEEPAIVEEPKKSVVQEAEVVVQEAEVVVEEPKKTEEQEVEELF